MWSASRSLNLQRRAFDLLVSQLSGNRAGRVDMSSWAHHLECVTLLEPLEKAADLQIRRVCVACATPDPGDDMVLTGHLDAHLTPLLMGRQVNSWAVRCSGELSQLPDGAAWLAADVDNLSAPTATRYSAPASSPQSRPRKREPAHLGVLSAQPLQCPAPARTDRTTLKPVDPR